MSYSVEYVTAAENDLAAIWAAASDRNAVADASNELDNEIAKDPLTLGEFRESSVRRIAFCPPLGVHFEVIEDDRRVIVEAVFRIPSN